MGKILLCVQSKVRDVNNILTIHNVHPQVRADVMRRLATLIYQVQEHLDTQRPAYDEAPEEICGVFVREIVQNVINSAIPLVELSTEGRRRVLLEERIKELEAELKRREQERSEAEEMLGRFRTVHDEMLHSYFREVLILRHQLHDCVTVMQRTRWGRMITLQCVPAELLNMAARGASRPVSGVVRTVEAPSKSKMEECGEVLPSGSSSFSGEESGTSGPLGMEDTHPGPGSIWSGSSPRQEASHADGEGLERRASVVSARFTQFRRSTGGKAGDTAPATPVSLSARSARFGGDREGIKLLTRRTVSVATQTAESVWGDPVNAIFDYEQYVRALTMEGLLGDEGKKLADTISSPGLSDEAARKALAEFLARRALGGILDKGDGCRTGLLSMLDQCSASVITAQIPTIVSHAQVLLRERLDELRHSVQMLRCQYNDDMNALRKAFEIIQGRVNSLLGFLETYAAEVRLITDFMEDPVKHLKGKHGEKGHVMDPRSRRVVASYFIDSDKGDPSTAAEGGGVVSDDKVDVFSVNSRSGRRREFNYWAKNEVVLGAKDAFARLQAASYSAVKRLFKGGKMYLGQGVGRRGMRGLCFGEGGEEGAGYMNGTKQYDSELGASPSADEEDEFLASLTREELLKLLVQRRLRRVALRARLSNCMKRLSSCSREGGEVDALQDILDEARYREDEVRSTTSTINKILALIGVTNDESDGEMAYFKKDLLFSPYLVNPAGCIGGDGQELVFVQVPVSAQHARSVYDSLMNNCTGYIVFNEEVIPIAQPLLTGSDYTTFNGNSRRPLRPRFLFTGSVVDYTRSVQLGRPLVGTDEPRNVCWDLENTQVPYTCTRVPTPESKKSVHYSTLTIPQLYQPPAEAYRPLPLVHHPNRSGNELVEEESITQEVHPPRVVQDIKVRNMKFRPPPERDLLPKTGINSPPKARLFYPEVHQPTAETKELFAVESLTLKHERRGIFDDEKMLKPKSRILSVISGEERCARVRDLSSKLKGHAKTSGSSITQCSAKIPSENFLRYRLPCLTQSEVSSGK